jgi:2-amino-4-hydroxy-6-hydroxymethyldihydropteridine diphosphokinase
MNSALVLFGSNIEPSKYLGATLDKLRELDEIRILGVSSAYEFDAVIESGKNDPSRSSFLNVAILLETELGISRLSGIFSKIESESGRIRTKDKFADRTVDLDILIVRCDETQEVIEPDVWIQAYAAIPAAEIAPNWRVGPNGTMLSDVAEGFRREKA